MSRTWKVVLPIALGALLLGFALVLAFGRDTGDPASSGPPVPASSVPAGTAAPSYPGPVLPGLAPAAAWSLPVDGSTTSVLAVGASLVVLHATGPETGRETPMRLVFHDPATGAVRGQVDTPVHTEPRPGRDGGYDVWADSWADRPALLVRHRTVEPSDGVTAEKRVDVVDAYGADGAKLGSVARPQSDDAFTVVNGWVVTEGSSGGTPLVTVAGTDGRIRRTVRCTGLACAVAVGIAETPVMRVGSSKIPIVVGNTVVEPERPDDSSGTDPLRLDATDLVTGEPAWSTATMPRPGRAVAESELTGVHAMPLAAVDDKLLMAWYTGDGSGFGDRGEILALHDRSSGRLLRTGPAMPRGTGAVVLDPARRIAVVADADREPHSVAWDLRDGRTLWTQSQDERPLAGRVIAGGHLYAYRSLDLGGGGHAPIVVDVRTRAVSPGVTVPDPLPVAASSGQVAVRTDDGLFVFAPA